MITVMGHQSEDKLIIPTEDIQIRTCWPGQTRYPRVTSVAD